MRPRISHIEYTLTSFVLILLAASPQLAAAQAVEQRPEIVKMDRARVALDARDYGSAVSLLEEGLAMAEQSQDRALQASFQFNLGLALQQRATSGNDAADARRAIAHYERYLELQPASGSALNNIAVLYAGAGRSTDAATAYRRAIALGDDRRGFYALNLATLLREQGDPKSAIPYYRMTLDQYPDHPEARAGLNAAYAEADLPGLVSHIWERIDDRREVSATLTALRTLDQLSAEAPADREARARRVELLTCVVVGLSRAGYGADLLAPDKAGARQSELVSLLRNLEDAPTIGPGVRDILAAYQSPPANADASWWAPMGNPDQDPDEGWWPRDGYRMLLRGLGDWHANREDPKTAEAYYLASVRLTQATDREPDLQALVRLAELYVEAGDTDRVQTLMDRYAENLFAGKGTAYKRSDWKKIYAFHRTLGIMYAMLDIWKGDSPITSAFFQLENALEKRVLYNERIAGPDSLPPIPLEPRLVELLAGGYDEQGDTARANNLRLTGVQQTIDENAPGSARRLLEGIDTATLTARQQARYRELRAQIQRQQGARTQ